MYKSEAHMRKKAWRERKEHAELPPSGFRWPHNHFFVAHIPGHVSGRRYFFSFFFNFKGWRPQKLKKKKNSMVDVTFFSFFLTYALRALLALRVPGPACLVSWFLGFLFSWFSWFPGFLVSWFPRFPGFQGFQGFFVSWFPGFPGFRQVSRLSSFLGFFVSWFLCFLVSKVS